MNRLEPCVTVTLSNELFQALLVESERLGVPLEWVVASLVADTIDRCSPSPDGVAA